MTQLDPADQAHVFDRAQLRRQRRRAGPQFPQHDFLFRELAERLLDRLADVTHGFPLAVDLSPMPGQLRAFAASLALPPDRIAAWLEAPGDANLIGDPAAIGAWRIACDEEALPFRDGSLDLVLSCLGLHWINDLPGALLQIRRALKPDGLFLGVMLGGDTLVELRQCLMEAELAETGGAGSRVAPMVGLRDAAALLQRAGFALPVADVETITLTYPDALALMRDLRGMGEGNALSGRQRHPTGRRIIGRAAAIYAARHAGADGRVRATIQALFLTGWAPDARQQQPARRGSGQVNLGDVLSGLRVKPDQS